MRKSVNSSVRPLHTRRSLDMSDIEYLRSQLGVHPGQSTDSLSACPSHRSSTFFATLTFQATYASPNSLGCRSGRCEH